MQYLKVARFSKFGAYLIDEMKNEVLLPNRYITDEVIINSLVWVFVYSDSEDRLVAITTMPKGFVGDILSLEIIDIVENGAYLDLGIPKDLFMPSKNPSHLKIGQKVVIKLTLDKQNRLIARQNLASYLEKLNIHSKIKNVDILPFLKTDIGFNCVVNNKYFGVIHNNDINTKINIGDNIKGIIKKIRQDGKVDLGLVSNINLTKNIILDKLCSGVLKLNFDSSSKEIFEYLGISKKLFKSASNSLIKENKVKFIKDSNGKLVLHKI
ncbi:S1-like domain-containing RNA-binding protein [Helicobacter sp. MIT 99-5507]|uniref:S1-like domain-containing RNA-binding protein n=1 Tax=Helicobacter sp. MIT 99-5507 TaxID=152489 RepID=UPI000E1F0E39|nr:S1-like domain-containing RNA-binding protein [Helicobacter sp. MIT 99-5507]RDU57557.1 hypothetical protein CQA42_06470 [Helicobacter sp. MIT 99-5507]